MSTLKTYCQTLQLTATHCSTLQHTATHCNTLQHTFTRVNLVYLEADLWGHTPVVYREDSQETRCALVTRKVFVLFFFFLSLAIDLSLCVARVCEQKYLLRLWLYRSVCVCVFVLRGCVLCVSVSVSNKAWQLIEIRNCDRLIAAATLVNTLQHTAKYGNTLQHTATHCNTLHHTATHD